MMVFHRPVVVRIKIISIRGKAGPRFGSFHPFPLKQVEDFQLWSMRGSLYFVPKFSFCLHTGWGVACSDCGSSHR